MPPQTLAADAKTPFSRYLTSPHPPRPAIADRPLKLLVAVANPDNLAEYDLEPIDVAAEQQAIEAACRAWNKGQVTLTFLPQPVTLAGLEARLQEGYHLLHIVAHGAYSEAAGHAALYLADAGNRVAKTTEDELAEMLARQGESLRLVYLAACQSATRSPADAFRGFAPKLVAAGVPAVLAMQDRVPVDLNREFTGAFYERLLRHGRADLACNEARAAPQRRGGLRLGRARALLPRARWGHPRAGPATVAAAAAAGGSGRAGRGARGLRLAARLACDPDAAG